MCRWLTHYALAGLAVLAVTFQTFPQTAERTNYNPYTGNYNREAVARNPYTGREEVVHTTTNTTSGATAARGATYNPYTGGYHGGTAAVNPATGTREESKTYYNPATGKTEHVQGAYNPYTGKYAYHYNYRR